MSAHGIFLEVALAWSALLLVALVARLVTTGSPIRMVVLADTLALSLVAALAILARVEEQPLYLDAALVMALLAFAGTVVAADRIVRRELE